MKRKILLLFLTISLVLSLGVGCSKNEDQDKNNVQKELETSNSDDDNQNESTDDNKEIEYVIYVSHKSIPVLFGERYTIDSKTFKEEGKTIEEIALNQLISFKSVGDLISPIPEGTEVLNINKDKDTVFVDLSRDFVENMKKDQTYTGLAVASIVNTITAIEGNEKVVITIEGKTVNDLNGVEMDSEFKFIEEYFADK